MKGLTLLGCWQMEIMWSNTKAYVQLEREGNGRYVTHMNTHINEIKYTTTYISKDQQPEVIFRWKWNLGTNKFNETEVGFETPEPSKLCIRSKIFALTFLEVPFVHAGEQHWPCATELAVFLWRHSEQVISAPLTALTRMEDKIYTCTVIIALQLRAWFTNTLRCCTK